MTTALRFANVSKRVDRSRQLHAVSMTVSTGSLVAVLAPSWGERDQVLHLAAGISKPLRGQVRVFGCNPYYRASVRRRIGVASPDVSLDRSLTVRRNLILASRLMGQSDRAIGDRMADLLERFRLSSTADVHVHKLDRHQQALVRIVRAALHQPALLLLGERLEPFDASLVAAIDHLLMEQASTESTILVTGRLDSRLASQCDRVILLSEGRLIAEASPQQLLGCLPSEQVDAPSPLPHRSRHARQTQLGNACRWILDNPTAIEARKRFWDLENAEHASGM